MKNIPLNRFFNIFNIFIVLMLLLPEASFSQSVRTIVIDPGHGGKFPGTKGKISREQDVALKISLLLGKAIEESMKDVKVIYTRTSDTELASIKEIDLRKRIEMANKANADLYISIHCNAMPPRKIVTYKKNSKGKRYASVTYSSQSSVKGVETFVAGSKRLNEQEEAIGEYAILKEDYKEDERYDSNDPETAIQISLMSNDLRKKSIQLATLMQEQYASTGRIDRGVQELSLAVLRTASMPSVLTEIGFLTNPEEEKYLNSEAGQTEVVKCLLNAIQAYKRKVELE